ncbi:hypothetical protein [Conexibacter sp. S30A1]|uniref:hypothetical protein n=1 Tax=Conexibacter sp. S30A1 TaxID=2937800 RepID=UPI00200E778F|nr:hypothetical protein [Conexibacter sp. S30A1]
MPRQARPTISTFELDELIEQATVDCYNDSEQVTGLFTTIEEHLAICTRDGHRQTIPIRDLPIPDPAPDGWEWIEAYRRWARWM